MLASSSHPKNLKIGYLTVSEWKKRIYINFEYFFWHIRTKFDKNLSRRSLVLISTVRSLGNQWVELG
jgi:hypothetical protein